LVLIHLNTEASTNSDSVKHGECSSLCTLLNQPNNDQLITLLIH